MSDKARQHKIHDFYHRIFYRAKTQLNAPLIVLLFALNTIPTTANQFYCFDPMDRKELKYSNVQNKSIDELPTIRFIQGFWDSQWATQYAAFIYLKEKMGVSVDWYPKSEGNVVDAEILFNFDFEEKDIYPAFYWNWIESDKYDLVFEQWPAHAGFQPEKYYADKTVLYVGTAGDAVFGEVGWFIPQYMVDENYLATSPHYLNANETLKNLLIEAYTNLSDINWIEYYFENKETIYAAANSDIFDNPTYDKPIIWGSSALFQMSLYSHNLTKNMFNKSGIDFTFIPLGSESKLTEFIVDLYSKHLPFIVNIYSPSNDFALNIGTNGEKVKFQRVSNPRNPSNAIRDECYIKNAECSQPIVVLFKLANPRLSNEFPEILSFVESFQMISTDVNQIMFYQRQVISNPNTSNNNITLHESWMTAACEWLKTHEQTTKTWYVDIIRYECADGGISTDPCDIDTTTSRMLLTLGVVVILIIIVIIVYKIIIFCKTFQQQMDHNVVGFSGNANDKDLQMLKEQKRSLIISICAGIFSFIMCVVDCGTDLMTCYVIVNGYRQNNSSYSKSFVIIYFTLSVIILFVSAIDIFITCTNVFIAYTQLKRGGLLDKLYMKNSDQAITDMEKSINELEFKKENLNRDIKKQSIIIFVAFCEDVPFLVLNLYGLNKYANGFILGSLVVNCISLGYKMRIVKEFFANIQEKSSLIQMISIFKAGFRLSINNKESVYQNVEFTQSVNNNNNNNQENCEQFDYKNQGFPDPNAKETDLKNNNEKKQQKSILGVRMLKAFMEN